MRPPVDVMKQTSWLSGLSAVRRSISAARGAHLDLVHAADGEHRAGELRLVEHVHDVALVLLRVMAALEGERSVAETTDRRMVAGRHRVEAEQIGTLGEPGELHRAVALDARVRRDPGGVRLDVRLDDMGVEVVTEVEHEVVDVELLGDASRVVDVGHRAASGVGVATPQLHRDTDDLVALLLEQERGNGGVDPAAHRTHHLHPDQARGDRYSRPVSPPPATDRRTRLASPPEDGGHLPVPLAGNCVRRGAACSGSTTPTPRRR